jgi:phospholipid transport system substrate-binding protein
MLRTPFTPSSSRRGWLQAVLAATVLVFAQPSFAAEDPKQTIQALVDAAFKILRDPALKNDRKARIGQLRTAADRVIDWEEMAKSSLGHHWRTTNEAQRAEFVLIFKDLLAKQYMDDIDRFQGTEKYVVKESEVRGELQIVKTTLITASKEQIPIDYTLHQAGGSWRVSDFSVEGVSMVNHFRNSFNRFLVNKDIGELIKQLRAKLGNL